MMSEQQINRECFRTLLWTVVFFAAWFLLAMLTGCQERPLQLQPVEFEAMPEGPSEIDWLKLEVQGYRKELEGYHKVSSEKAQKAMSDVEFLLMKLDLRIKGQGDDIAKLSKKVEALEVRAKARPVQPIAVDTKPLADALKNIASNFNQPSPAKKSEPQFQPPPGLLPREPEPKKPEPKPEPKPDVKPAPKPEPVSQSTEPLPSENYADALERSLADKRPLIVLIGAKWCGPCKAAHAFLPKLRAKGHLAYIDADADPARASKISRGDDRIPYLGVWFHDAEKKQWFKSMFFGPKEIQAYAESGQDDGPAMNINCEVPQTEKRKAVEKTAEKVDENDALDEVNATRAARSLRPYIRDDGLTQGAIRAAAYRAARRIAGHTSNDFGFLPSGSTAAVAGCAAWQPGTGWGACATYDNYTYAGAAWAMGSDGLRYMHLFVR